MSELKPCPFCGSNNINQYLSLHGETIVYCIDCYEQNDGARITFDIWNTRPIEDGLRAEIARLNVIAIDAVTLNDELIGKVKRLNEYIKALENEPIRSKSVIKRLRAQTIEREE